MMTHQPCKSSSSSPGSSVPANRKLKLPSPLATVNPPSLYNMNTKQFILAIVLLAAFAGLTQAGTVSGKEMKQAAVAPCDEYYANNEWNVQLWGTYAFTGTEYNPNVDPVDLIVSTTEGATVLGSFDKYIGGDHAWGGGGDVKYFFMRYFGIGIQGFVLGAKKSGFDIDFDDEEEVFFHERTLHRRAIGSVLGTFTLRYPVPCTRFAPYAWAGVGAIFGGGESDTLTTHVEEDEEIGLPQPILGGPKQEEGGEELEGVRAETRHYGSETKL